MSEDDRAEKQATASAMEIRQRAADWVLERHASNSWTDQRQQALDEWLAEAPSHLLAFWRLNAALERTERLAALHQPRSDEVRSNARGRFRPVFLKTAVAAMAAVAVTLVATMHFPLKPREAIYATGIGGRETLRLADGSRIELNTDTRIRVDLTPARRIVTLERGEAAFSVRHNPGRPFVVLALGHRITDLGTKFWVREYSGKLQVALMEGQASFESADPKIQQHSVMLKPGDVVIATSQTMSVSKYVQRTLTRDLAWRSGMLIFDETPLADVVTEFNRYNRNQLDVRDPQIASIKVDGTFRVDNTRGLLDMVQHVLRLRVERQGSRMLITR